MSNNINIAEINGRYNFDTLQVEPIKSKCEFKPFDKVLVRDDINEKWLLSIFLCYEDEVDHTTIKQLN